MPLQTLATTLAAAERGYAVGAFNVSDLNQAIAVLDAARAERSPVIVQTIAGASAYSDESWWWHTTDRPRELRRRDRDSALDHGRTLEDCIRAIDHGFTSVMIDASRSTEDDEPNDFESNVAVTRSVVDVAHARGVSVEGELGTIGGAEAGMTGVIEEIVCRSSQAEEFVVRTGVDALAVAVGTSHGSVKFTDQSGGQRLRISLIAEIKNRLPDTALVLHGSSLHPGRRRRGHQQAGRLSHALLRRRRNAEAGRDCTGHPQDQSGHGFTPGLDRGADRTSANVPPRSSPVRPSLPQWLP